MKGNARDFKTGIEYDEAEVARRLGEVYSLLLDAARQKRLREAQQAVAVQGTEVGLPSDGGQGDQFT